MVSSRWRESVGRHRVTESPHIGEVERPAIPGKNQLIQSGMFRQAEAGVLFNQSTRILVAR